MKFCQKCGAQMEDQQGFCPLCGEPANSGSANPNPTPNQNPNMGNGFNPGGAPNMGPNYTQQPARSGNDAEDNKVMGIIAYLGILCLVPLFAAKESEFAQFHAKQGFTLFLAEIVGSIVFNILGAALPWQLSFITGLLSAVVWIGMLVFSIMGIVSAINGEMKELPIIGNIKILK